jgi:predicted GIY-YIG superfamily endonuclease
LYPKRIRCELRLGTPVSAKSVTEREEVCEKADKRRWVKFFYTYILQSEKTPDRFYIGFTEDLESRMKAHNQGKDPHTSKYKPWRLKTATAFTDRQKALDFEAYLKTHSGRAFAKKRL